MIGGAAIDTQRSVPPKSPLTSVSRRILSCWPASADTSGTLILVNSPGWVCSRCAGNGTFRQLATCQGSSQLIDASTLKREICGRCRCHGRPSYEVSTLEL
jgi:hypothetical protein